MKTYTFALDRETKNFYRFLEQHPSGGTCTRNTAEVNCGNPLYLKRSDFGQRPIGVKVTIEAIYPKEIDPSHAQG